MKKILSVLGIVFFLVMLTGVLAETGVLSKDIEDVVEKAVETKGIQKEDIKSIEKVNFSDLPEQIDIKNIDETNLAMYEVDVGTESPIFVLTLSEESFTGFTKHEVINKMLLNFGLAEQSKNSQFLESATGIKGSTEKGYVMMRQGSINGISTSIEILNESTGNIDIIVYKNSKEIGFRNTIDASTSGIKKDFDLVEGETIRFEPGDVISVYIKVNGIVIYQDINTLVEISTYEDN